MPNAGSSEGSNVRPSTGLVPFFVAALGITWGLQTPAVLAYLGVIAAPVEKYMLPAALGGFGPLLAAVLVAARESGRAGLRELFRPMKTFRVGLGWYAVALFGFAALSLTATGVHRLLGGGGERLAYFPENAQHVAALLVIPLAEEPGWRGFALPRLQRRFGPLRASVVLGVLWALWHSTMFVLQRLTPAQFALGFVSIFFGSVIFTWLYNRTHHSLLIAVLAHAGVHLDNPFRALPGTTAPLVTYAIATAIAAVLVVLIDRRAFARSATE